MNFIKWTFFIVTLGSLFVTSLQAMASTLDTEFNVILTTDLSIDVTTEKNGKTITSVLHPTDPPASLGQLKNLAQEGAVILDRHGKWIGVTTSGLKFSANDLSAKWRELQQNDNDPLVINISSVQDGQTGVFRKLIASYSTTQPTIQARVERHNPLNEFGGLAPYASEELLNTLFRLNPADWQKVVVPGTIYKAYTDRVTAEDAYRYILGVKTNYTLDDINASYRALSRKWHTDKNRKQANAKYKDEVMKVINNAHAGLLQALADKNPSATSSTTDVTQ